MGGDPVTSSAHPARFLRLRAGVPLCLLLRNVLQSRGRGTVLVSRLGPAVRAAVDATEMVVAVAGGHPSSSIAGRGASGPAARVPGFGLCQRLCQGRARGDSAE